MIRIAVLDSAAYCQHPIFKEKQPTLYSIMNNEWQKQRCCDNITQLYPHGTAVCGILAKHTPPDVELFNFDVYDKNPKVLTQKTLSALNFILQYINCDLINMSMGVRTPNQDLEDICRKITDKGITIVSAFDNAGAISYPAAYPFVIGVDTSPRCTHADDFVYVENSPVNIRAKGGIQRLAWTDPLYTINQGSSFAAPYVTAYLAFLYAQGMSREEAIQEIIKISKHTYKGADSNHSPDMFPIKNAALFPYNKEMQSVISFREHLSFTIQQICDTKYSGHIGLSVKGLFDNQDAYSVQSVDNLDWQSIDTLILGHTSELEGTSGKAIKSAILQQCLNHGKNVYSFDKECLEDFRASFKEKGIELYCPNDVNPSVFNHFGKLYLLKAPVLGIFGTTKKQGKFTMQLQLRYHLQKLGYKVGQLGTEPTSKLFDMDEIYPFGYNGIANNDLLREIEETNWLMHRIDERNPDIILVGSQSGTIPMSYYNIGQIPLHQMAFLLGTKPDAVILCINVDDTDGYIERTINVIENLGCCKVIALAIYPFMFSNGWGIIRNKKEKVTEEMLLHRKELLEKRFQLPVSVTGEKDSEDLLINACLRFFGGNRDVQL